MFYNELDCVLTVLLYGKYAIFKKKIILILLLICFLKGEQTNKETI